MTHIATLRHFLEMVNSSAVVGFTEHKLLAYNELRRLLLGWLGWAAAVPSAGSLFSRSKAVRPRESLLL